MKYKILIIGKYEYFDTDFHYEFVLNRKPKKDYLENVIEYFTKECSLSQRLIKKSIKVSINKFKEAFIFDYCI